MSKFNMRGKMTLTIHAARNLVNRELLGKMDPFAVLVLSNGKDAKFKTKVCKDGHINPVWEQAYIFNLEGQEELLHCNVWNEAVLGDTNCGRLDLSLDALDLSGTKRWYALHDRENFSKQTGEVAMSIIFEGNGIPQGSVAFTTNAARTAAVSSPVAAAAPVAVAVAPVAAPIATLAAPVVSPNYQTPPPQQYSQPPPQQYSQPPPQQYSQPPAQQHYSQPPHQHHRPGPPSSQYPGYAPPQPQYQPPQQPMYQQPPQPQYQAPPMQPVYQAPAPIYQPPQPVYQQQPQYQQPQVVYQPAPQIVYQPPPQVVYQQQGPGQIIGYWPSGAPRYAGQ